MKPRANDCFVVKLERRIVDELKRVHPRFAKKAEEWANSIAENGLTFTQKLKGDHPLKSFRKENREDMWATRLNHRYRLIYRYAGSIEVLKVDSHNKQFY